MADIGVRRVDWEDFTRPGESESAGRHRYRAHLGLVFKAMGPELASRHWSDPERQRAVQDGLMAALAREERKRARA